jgi:hypothetical protein
MGGFITWLVWSKQRGLVLCSSVVAAVYVNKVVPKHIQADACGRLCFPLSSPRDFVQQQECTGVWF